MQRSESPASVLTTGSSEKANASYRASERRHANQKPSYRLFPSVEPTPPASPPSLQKRSIGRALEYHRKRSISLDDTARRHVQIRQPQTSHGLDVQNPLRGHMSTVPESPLDSPTVPVRYSIVSRISEDSHARSNSAPGEYIRDSQVLPAQRTVWTSKQSDSHPLSPKGLGLSMPVSRLADVPPKARETRRPRPNLSIAIGHEETPPPPPPKSPRHSRTSSAQSGVSSLHEEPSDSPILPTPGSIKRAAMFDAHGGPIQLPPALHSKQGSSASSAGSLRVREIVVTREQTAAKSGTFQSALIPSGGSSPQTVRAYAGSNQSTPTGGVTNNSKSSPPASREHDRTLNKGPVSMDAQNLSVDLPQPLRVGSSTANTKKPEATTTVLGDSAQSVKTLQRPSASRMASKASALNLDKPMPSLPSTPGGLADHLREVQEAEEAERKRSKSKTSLPSFPSFPARSSPDPPFARTPDREGSPSSTQSRLHSRDPSRIPDASPSQRQSEDQSPATNITSRPQSPANARKGACRSVQPSPLVPVVTHRKVDSHSGRETPKLVERPRSPIRSGQKPVMASQSTFDSSSKFPAPPRMTDKSATGRHDKSMSAAAALPTRTTSIEPAGTARTGNADSSQNEQDVTSSTIKSSPPLEQSQTLKAPDIATNLGEPAPSPVASLISRAHAQAHSASSEMSSSTNKPLDASSPDLDPAQLLQSLSTQTDALYARYAQLRGDRVKLSTAISLALREQKPGSAYANVLLDQHVSLNQINSSMDICFAKMKRLDCRKEDAIAALVARMRASEAPRDDLNMHSTLSPVPPTLTPESNRSTPDVEQKTLSPTVYQPGKPSPFVSASAGMSPRTLESSLDSRTMRQAETLIAKEAATTRRRDEDKTLPPEPPMSPMSVISSLEEEKARSRRIRIKGAKAAKLLGLVAQSTNSRTGSPDITLPDKSSLERLVSNKQLAVEVEIHSRPSEDRDADRTPTIASVAAMPKRKPSSSTRQGTNDSVSSTTTGESATEEPDVQTPPQSPDQPFGLKSAKRGMLQTIQVFVDDDILDYYNGSIAR